PRRSISGRRRYARCCGERDWRGKSHAALGDQPGNVAPIVRIGKRRPGRHGAPADEAQHALAEGGDDLALVLLRVVDELVDDEIRAGSHREGRAVHQEHLHEPGARGVYGLIVEDGTADLNRCASLKASGLTAEVTPTCSANAELGTQASDSAAT